MPLVSRTGRWLALLACLWACALSPVQMSLEDEQAEGLRAVEALRSEVGFVEEGPLTEYVRSIGERLAAHSPRKDLEYRFYIVDREDVNAFAVPGGHIFVTRGLLALADSEDELANVMGHEIGHVAARHYASRSWKKTGGNLLAVLGGIAGSFIGLSEVASRPGRSLVGGHDRDQEREADEIGQRMAAESGWDPLAMTEFLRKLEADVIIALGAKPEESILDSHPTTAERIAKSEARAEKLEPGERVAVSRDAYLERMAGLTLGADPRGGVFEKEVFLHPDLNLRVRFPANWVTVNRPAFVAAIDPPAQIRVDSAGAGTDLEAKARAFLRAQATPADGPQPPLQPEGDPAAAQPGAPEAAATSRAQREFTDFRFKLGGKRQLGRKRVGYALDGDFFAGKGTARIYFIGIGGSTYRVICAMPTPLVQRYMGTCDKTASSMRPLARSERERVEWTRLQVESAREGETLPSFNERTHNRWTESQTAAANGLGEPYQLHEGQRLKIARAEIYSPKTAAEVDATEDADEAEDDEDPQGTGEKTGAD